MTSFYVSSNFPCNKNASKVQTNKLPKWKLNQMNIHMFNLFFSLSPNRLQTAQLGADIIRATNQKSDNKDMCLPSTFAAKIDFTLIYISGV